MYIKDHHIETRGHNILHRLVTETDYTLKHLLLVLDFIIVGKFQGLLKFINRKKVVLFGNKPLSEGSRADKECRERQKYL